MHTKSLYKIIHRSNRISTSFLLALALLQCLLGTAGMAQNITTVVAPGGSVDIQNNSGARWYFTTAPSPSGATMARVSSDYVSVYTWPNRANFTADPVNNELNRIFQGEFLRVYANSLPVNTVITIPYSTPLPGNSDYTITVIVGNDPYVTAINLTDPSPTVAATVHWAVNFTASVSGITAANFQLTNPDGLSGADITDVSGSGSNWVVTAYTGTGTGLLGCNYIGHVNETPEIPATFTGQEYTFSQYPLITTDLAPTNIAAGSSCVLSVAATIRGGGTVNYQWYRGTSSNPNAATLISGATSSTYTVSGVALGSPQQFFCRTICAANTAYTTDSSTATVTAFTPVSITSTPAGTAVVSGQTATFTVAAAGTAPHYQWYQGVSGNTATPVGTDSSTYTTAALAANTSFWVEVYNALPSSYNQNSATISVQVAASLTSSGSLAALVNQTFLPAPTFTLTDSTGAPVVNFPVELTVNGGAASASFGGSSSVTINSGTGGVVTSPLTANGVAGSYTVTASAGPGVTTTITLLNVAQLQVTTAVDENNGTIDPGAGSGLSLREAVTYADTHSNSSVITFSPALAGQTIFLTNGWSGTGDSSALLADYNVSIQGLATHPGIILSIAGTQRRHFYVSSSSTLSLANLTLENGYAADYGGSVWSYGSLIVSNCTFTGNFAGTEGGAIQTWGGSSPLLEVMNSTIVSNTSADYASAIGDGSAQSSFDHVTIADNTSSPTGGALWFYNTQPDMSNSIVALNTPEGVQTYGSGAFAPASVNNLLDTGIWPGLTSGVNGNLVVTSSVVNLGALADNGGPTPTVALLGGSPAINAGIVDAETTDQRGLPRVGPPDMGAYEFQGVAPAVTSVGSATFMVGIPGRFAFLATGNPAPQFAVTGTLPSGVTLSAGGLLSGAPAAGTAGTYTLTITATNGFAPNYVESFALAVVGQGAIAARPAFNTNGLGWALNGDSVNGGPAIVDGVFTLTDGTGGESRSAWFGLPLYAGAFQASFTYQDVGGNGADGTAFVIQNDPRGPAALGAPGGGLGYAGISPSVAIMMNIYSGSPGGLSGILLATNGMGDGSGYQPTDYETTLPVILDAGNPVNVHLLYLNGILQVNLTDTVTSAVFQTNFPVDLSAYLGTNAAWVGMTGSEGGIYSHQTVSNFTYLPLPTLQANPGTAGGLTLNWPGAVAGFVLQSKTNLSDPNWTTVSGSISQTNSLNQMLVPPATGSQFYRLMLP